ncbi:MAG TPA: PD-(D/E)XK nuclease family protein [Acidimicrobiales bacterium]|nr:PD-(D/E)XK nuclease family protein [Acidimicrobiales bacterium]
MSLVPPRSLSPSKLSAFKDCPLAFRFSAIDRLPEVPSAATFKGTLVHRALEGLFWNHPRGGRTRDVAQSELRRVWEARDDDPEWLALELPDEARDGFLDDAAALVDAYFRLEDPNAVNAVGMELTLEAEVDGVCLRGIVDRLDVTPEGEFVVVDYKTGRVPSVIQEQQRLAGVQFYALLCEAVLGRRPARVQLMYLRGPLVIEAAPSEQALRGTRQRASAVWTAIERACATDDFRPRPSALCGWCSFRSLCPVYAGEELAATG